MLMLADLLGNIWWGLTCLLAVPAGVAVLHFLNMTTLPRWNDTKKAKG